MKGATSQSPISSRKFDKCRQIAATAAVGYGFAVYRDARSFAESERELTSSFAKAFKTIKRRPFGMMRIVFGWQIGDRKGQALVEYRNHRFPMGSEHFVRQTIQNLVTERIAEALYTES